MTALDPRAITPLLRAVAEWVAGPGDSLWISDLIGALLVHSLRDSRNDDPVREILDSYLEPRWERRGEFQQASLRVSKWEIQEFARNAVPHLIEVNGLLLLSVLAKKLDAVLDRQFPETDEIVAAKEDYSTVWLGDLSSDEHIYGAEALIAHLATRTLDAIAASGSVGPNRAIEVLDDGAWLIHRRLGLHLLSRCVHIASAHDNIIGRLTDASLAGSHQTQREYDALLHATFPSVSHNERLAILSTLLSTAEEKGADADIWLYERLAGIASHLTGDWSQRFDDYAERFGEPRELPPSISVTWGPAHEMSPLSADEARGLSATEVAEFTRDWVPPNVGPLEGPTWKGLAKQVEALAKERPTEFSAAATAFTDMNRTVITAVLRGLKDAVRDGHGIDWHSALDLVRAVVSKDEGRDRSEYLGFGDDTSWSGVKHEVSELLQAGLGGKVPAPLALQSQLWETVELLVAHGAAPDRVELDDVRDSVFAALNTTRSLGVYTAVAYLLWLRRSGAETVPAAADRFFQRILDHESEPFIGMRAAVAHQLPQLSYVDEDWAARLLPAIFPDRDAEHWSAAWDAYVRYAKPLPPRSILQALANHYAAAIKLMRPDLEVAINRDPRAHLGIHLVMMFLNGLQGLDHDNMVAFFEQAPAPIRAHVVDWVGRSAAHSGLSPEWLARAQEFFEWRERDEGSDGAELRKLGWFVASGAFPVAWWAPRLPTALSASPTSLYDVFVPVDDMMAQVAAASGDHPGMALEVLEIVIDRNKREWHEPYVVPAETILGRAARIPELEHRASGVADQLVRAGYEQFESFSSSA